MVRLELVGLGFIVGSLMGLTGVGGGVLMTPILILLYGVQPSIAIGTDLFYAAITKVMGAIRHWRQGSVDLRIAVTLAFGSLPAALVGIVAAKVAKDARGQAVEPIITAFLARVCILVGVLMLLRLLIDHLKVKGTGNRMMSPRLLRTGTLVLGILTGILVGLSSIGAGTIVLMFLTMLYRLPMKRLVGTDLFHAAMLASASALGHAWAGNVDFSLAGLLLAGSVPGVILGSHISIRIPDKALQVSVAILLAFSGSRLLAR